MFSINKGMFGHPLSQGLGTNDLATPIPLYWPGYTTSQIYIKCYMGELAKHASKLEKIHFVSQRTYLRPRACHFSVFCDITKIDVNNYWT
jgi:hypothetical protein